jgi:N6-adenosine-specific RNA methylase IME4
MSAQPSPSFPTRFGAILCDPPWAFRTHAGKDRTPTAKKFNEAEDHYPTMSIVDMAALPVGEWAAKDCALFMWVVGSHLDAAMELGRAWGFTFKTDVFWWLKQRLIGGDQIDLFTGDLPEPKISMGYWSRKQGEMVLLFTRGSPRRLSMGVRQLIIEPPREHSRKPDAIYERVEALVGGPYLEMFARQSRPGWSVFGNEVGKFDAVGVAAPSSGSGQAELAA